MLLHIKQTLLKTSITYFDLGPTQHKSHTHKFLRACPTKTQKRVFPLGVMHKKTSQQATRIPRNSTTIIIQVRNKICFCL